MKHWSSIAESGAVWSISFMFWVYRTLGRWAFSIVLYPVILYYFLSNAPARAASQDYLRRLQHHQVPLPKGGLKWLSYRHFLTFGSCILDKLAAMAGYFSHGNVDVHYPPELLEQVKQGRGGVVFISHLGNAEVSRALSKELKNVRLNILVHTKNAESFNRVMLRIDPESQLNLLQVTEVNSGTAMVLSEKIDAGEFIVIAADRTPINSNRVVPADFFGEKANFPQGPFLLASILKAPVFTMFCNKQASNRYRIVFSTFAETIQLRRGKREQDLGLYAQKYADELAAQVKQHPMEWNNFFDFWQPLSPPSISHERTE